MGIFGTMGGLQGSLGAALPAMMNTGGKVPGGEPRRRRGLFGRIGSAIGDFDPTRILLAQALTQGDYGAAAQLIAAQQRQRGERAEAETEREAEGRRMEALESMGFSKDQISGMRAQDISALARERLQPRQFASSGGSLLDPSTGQFTQAPSRHEYQGSVFDIGPDGQPVVRREGVQAVPLQPGGSVAMINSYTGEEVGPGGIGAAPPPGAGPQPGAVVNGYRFRGGNPNDRNSWEPVADGGATPAGSRNFR